MPEWLFPWSHTASQQGRRQENIQLVGKKINARNYLLALDRFASKVVCSSFTGPTRRYTTLLDDLLKKLR
jgi:hypothetical protein